MIAGNEAHRIARTLESVRGWTHEIILAIDDKVTDGTDKIAEAYGAKIVSQPWHGPAEHQTFASSFATQPWLLSIDADEVVSEELRAEIIAIFENPGHRPPPAAYSFPRLSFFCGRWIRHGNWYPDRKVRLWRKGCGRWEGYPHEKLVLSGRVIHLRSNLLHYSTESIDHSLAKIARFSSMFIRHCREEERTVGWVDLAVRPFWKFFRAYILRLGFLDGWPGYFIAWRDAFNTVTRYTKVLEAQQAQAKSKTVV